MSVTVGVRRGIVARGYAQHVFKRPGPQLGKAVNFHGTGVGDENDFRTLQHEDARTFGKLPVVTDHGADLDRAFAGFEFGGAEPVPRREQAFFPEIAGMHFGVVKHFFAPSVEERERVARRGRKLFQIGNAYRHAEFLCAAGEPPQKFAVGGDGLLRKIGGRTYAVTVAPHFGKEGEIRPRLFCGPAVRNPLFDIAPQRAFGQELQQGYFKCIHNASLETRFCP